MTRSVVRREWWSIVADTEPDAEPATCSMRCAVCGQSSPSGLERAAAQAWCLDHSGRYPSHRTYRETLKLPYRTYPNGALR